MAKYGQDAAVIGFRRRQAQLAEDVSYVLLHGPFRNDEPAGDGDCGHDFVLPVGQDLDRTGPDDGGVFGDHFAHGATAALLIGGAVGRRSLPSGLRKG
jgi:hypothetical protein